MEEFQDIYLEVTEDGYYDIVIENGDIKLDSSLDSTVITKIGTDSRVSEKIMSNPMSRGGWIGNLYFDNTNNEFTSQTWVAMLKRDVKSELIKSVKNSLNSLTIDGSIKNVDINIINKGNGEYECYASYYINNIPTNKSFIIWSETRWQ